MINDYSIFDDRVEISVPQKLTGEVFVFTVNVDDFEVIDSKNSWSMDKNNTSAVANFRSKDGKMCKITMHKALAGWRNVNFVDGDRFNLRRENLVEGNIKTRRRRAGKGSRNNSFAICGDFVKIFLKNKTTDSVAFIDKEDLDKVNCFCWNINTKTGYVQAMTREGRGKSKHVYMHRIIMGAACEGKYVDHISGNRLDNRKKNLRICTNSENLHNNPRANKNNKTTGVRGVSRHKDGTFVAQMKVQKLHLRRGFRTLEDALAQRKAWEDEYLDLPFQEDQ